MSSVKEGRDQMLVDKSQAQGICMSSGGALEGQQSLCANARACVCTCLHTCTRWPPTVNLISQEHSWLL